VFLQHGASPLEIWHDQKWAVPINIAVTGFGGGILALAVQESGPLGVIIFFMPILLSAYSFRLYVKRTEEERTKLEELVELRTADLGAAKRELEQLHEEKDAFLAVLSHDMRSPLTNIHGYASLLMSQPDMSSEEREKMLRVVIRNEKTLLEIVNNILELRQLQAGNQILLSKEPLNIALVIVESVENTVAFARDKDIDLSYEIGDIEDPRRYFIMGDKGQLSRVIQNLISNAVKYTPSGGQVIVKACPEETEISVEVVDTGYGIPEEDLPRIFDSFHRVEGHRGLAGGTGLGLAIVKNIINAHKGTITVESVVDKGSKFTVKIPK
jgi:signal transduction histidine kinase